MNKRRVGAVIQWKLLGVFVFWPKATLATLVLCSRLRLEAKRRSRQELFRKRVSTQRGGRKCCWKERRGCDSGKRSGGGIGLCRSQMPAPQKPHWVPQVIPGISQSAQLAWVWSWPWRFLVKNRGLNWLWGNTYLCV